MVVECEACHAKFKLDDSKVPDKGIKVRCSKCKHVFMVQRPAPPVEEPAMPTLAAEEALGVSESPPPPAEEPAVDERVKKEEEFQIDDSEAESFVADAAATGAEEPEGEPEETFESTIKIDLSDQQEMPFEEEEAFPEEEIAEEVPRKKAVGSPILIAIIVLVVIGVLAAAYFLVLPNFMGPPETPTSNLTTSNIDGYFEQNVQIPKIFVIKGTVINESKKPRRFIQVKGILYNKKGNPVKVHLAYCGNLISKKDLKTKSPKFIQKAMNNKSGSRGENNLVKPGASIPFMVVFFYLPDEMTEYSVEVVNSQFIK